MVIKSKIRSDATRYYRAATTPQQFESKARSIKLGNHPTVIQRPKDVFLSCFFGRDVPNHNRTKIRRIRFLTYFDSTMHVMHLESGNIEKIL